MSSPRKRQAVYPWVICGSCVLLIFCSIGLGANTMPVYFPFLAEAKGFNNAQLSAITTIRCGFALLAMGLLPRLMERIRLRLLPSLSCLILAASLLLMSAARGLFTLYLSAAGLGLAYGIGSMVLVSVLVRRWFCQREGFALSLCASGSGLANVAASPLLTWAVEALGLGAAFALEAAAVAALGALMFALVRDDPEELGLRPYGKGSGSEAGPRSYATASADKTSPKEQKVREVGEVRMSPGHRRLMILAMLATGPTNITTLSFYTLHYTNCGYSPMTIAAGLSLFGLALTVSKLIYGWCNDRFGVYRCNLLFMGVSILGNLLVGYAGLFQPGLVLFLGMGLCALGYPPMMIGISLWARDLWPAADYTKKVALYQQLSMAGGMAGTLLGGFSADISGGYAGAYTVCVILLAFSLFVVEYLYRYYGKGA